ncbi:MAG: hypothetical protein A2568_01745 [Candidatus Yanofskybacteria bacterium RIFOXYD1_FULL_44_17]|uniref:Peptidase C39 domain-containing protein n=1 Tax=Candidatus Yanofskybacteria bacterium GW2011_GWE2_40_11 TaxID=1619033 RepID=A0A0G0QM66_9BACT|nr:MAG: hypothetical protein UT75_C0001G0112 [Candidatus Yanofskybacteria bacterium GW2011_GWE2_40_11]OGN36190.1 MAG: hypothetical protein A2241_00380 [Candidatus Yanofskybacteria bacterium RIFOXYA2_FULL_45_28]OGN36906.1 MAG: hypothetical protein A2207_01030 [Candidatus Yanofskybacteria bacterium RIFOXYA1_FULL_44_17]OGN38349.1 MAG: hypothetical protein A2405_01300 [Candidatus Yanofskybacteria bacterium RIFOXYC1_FULL_44_16]OGN38527.1 MAG: hypothetical protein A2302_00425 [Candidatus Yanofskybact
MVFLRPAYKQPNAWTCGPAVARIILHSFGRKKTLREISKELSTTRAGTANKDLKRVFKKHGLSFTEKEGATTKDLKAKLKTHWIIIAYWIPKHKEAHYSIVRRVTSKRVYFHDTWFGSNHSYSVKHFMKYWWDDEATRWFLAVKKPTSFAARILKPIFRWIS